jgi:hypothetical protein
MLPQQLHDQGSLAASVPDARSGLDAAREQVDRILASDTLHASEVLRRLMRFLADKTFSGEADRLKEYSVGLDALGKPASYDPRQDSGVRLQASRLRQKLDEYYRTEGSNDPLTIELPRGKFKIVWHPRGGESVPVAAVPLSVVGQFPAQTALPVESHDLKRWRGLAIGLAVASLILACIGIWSIRRASRALAANTAISKSTPELDALWSPFLSSAHHLIIVYSDPVFVRFERKGSPDIVYRRRNVSGWDEAVNSPEFAVLKRSLGNPPAKPSFDYAVRSELVSTFVLGQFFASRRGDISLTRLGELSWQQFADNDVVMLAPRYKIDEKQTALPIRPAFIADKAGIRNLRPLEGEPPVYEDPQDHPESDGETLELVSVMPGPLGRTKIESFTGNRAWGVIGAVQSLTDPAFARVIAQKLREPSGEIPPYYQVVIRIRYRDGTPTNASYVVHRTLALTPR